MRAIVLKAVGGDDLATVELFSCNNGLVMSVLQLLLGVCGPVCKGFASTDLQHVSESGAGSVGQCSLQTYALVDSSELRSCVKVEVAVLGSPVPDKPTVSVDVKEHFNYCFFGSPFSSR